MQILEKYSKDYKKALCSFREIRKRFYERLSKINGLRVIPSQANYFMCELTCKMTSKDFCTKLLEHSKCLIKDLSGKSGIDGKYIRIAIKTDSENELLAAAIENLLKTV